jgi:hypothetical protein
MNPARPVHYTPAPASLETEIFRINLFAADFAELIMKDNAVFTVNAARQSKSMLENANPGVRYHLLVSCEGFFRVTRGARKTGADAAFSTHLAAVACYTSNPSLWLLGELYNKINKPVVSTSLFLSRDGALKWLSERAGRPLGTSAL